MSDTFDAAAHAAAMDAAHAQPEPSGVPQTDQNAAPQADQTPSDTAALERTTDPDPTDAPETPSRGDKRVQQLLTERHQLRERLAYLEGIAQRQQTPAEAPQQAAPRLPPDLAQWVGDEPKPDAFPAGEFDPQYLRAIARHEARTEQAQIEAARRHHAAAQAEAQRSQTFMQQAEKMAAEKPDFRDAVAGLGNHLANWQANLIAEAGAEVAYAIAKDTDTANRIRAARSPAAVAIEVGRTMERLARAKEAPIPQPTNAPEPPARAVRGGNVGHRDPAAMSMSEYAEWSRKQFG